METSDRELDSELLILRSGRTSDATDIVALNLESVAVTSPMDEQRFLLLLELSCLCIVAEIEERVVGFVLAMRTGAEYDNGNYQWFAERLQNFLYVDRVVVSKDGRGLGVGSALYTHAVTWATGQRLARMAAEMDLDPPNEGSLSFHRKRGFAEIGSRKLESGKIVSMQVRWLE